MAIIARKCADGSITYSVAFYYQRKQIWEVSGKSRRDAIRLDARRKREVKNGTYIPQAARKALTIRQWATSWLSTINVRSKADYEDHVNILLAGPFADMALEDVRPRHALDWIEGLKKEPSPATGRPRASKTIGNIFGTAHTLFQAAVFREFIPSNPMVLPKGTISRKVKKRRPYSTQVIRKLCTDPKIRADRRVWFAIAAFTGMRLGELSALKWSSWDRSRTPLTALVVRTQYDDRPLKGTDFAANRHRLVPVHRDLEAILTAWFELGWEAHYGRKPELDDHVCPMRRSKGERVIFTHRTRSSAYRGLRTSLTVLGEANLSHHALRNTFISLARNAGARAEVIEVITHNSADEETIDGYTEWEYRTLCEAVSVITNLLSDLAKS